MPASVEEIEEAESEGIVVNPGWGPKEVLVDENGEVRGIVLKKCLSVKDADGRFNPQYDENQLLTVECKHVFFSVGPVSYTHLDNDRTLLVGVENV